MSRVKFCAKFTQRTWRRNTVQSWTSNETVTAGVWGAAKEELTLKMNNQLSTAERKHLASVKELPCGVCGAAGPSDAHHIEQGLQYTCIPLCKDCHQGPFNGIHGQKRIWNVYKKTEMSVLNETIKKLLKPA